MYLIQRVAKINLKILTMQESPSNIDWYASKVPIFTINYVFKVISLFTSGQGDLVKLVDPKVCIAYLI